MSSTATLVLALVVYTLAAAYLYRHPLQQLLGRRRGVNAAPSYPSFGPGTHLLAVVLLLALGGIMVLAGTALVFDSGNLGHALPLSGQEFVQLLKDVVPGLLSIVVGFLVLESTQRLQGGRGLRSG